MLFNLSERHKKNNGQILILALVVVGLVLVNTLMIISGSLTFFQNSAYILGSTEAVNLAEAGADKALVALNISGGNYNGESETFLGGGSFSVTITSPNSNTKIIESTGFIPSKANPKVRKTVRISAAKGVGIAFNYGVQVGGGGLEMSNGSIVDGSVYSNGNIFMKNDSKIIGDVYVAGGVAAVSDQESSCFSLNCSDYFFGRNIDGQERLDIGQSFQPTASSYLNKVSLNLKKIGSPSDITLRILGNSNGQPDKNNVLASGVLFANLVTSDYGFVDIALSTTPYLTAETVYWIVLDTSSNNNNYWSNSADSLQGYTRGEAKWSPNWQSKNPVWNTVNLDLDFKTYMGGEATYIQGSNGVTVGGNAHAHILRNLSISGSAYYQVLEDTTASAYYPGSSDPVEKVLPISSGNIQFWKNEAEKAGVYTGDITSCQSNFGPGKYIGNVAFGRDCMVKLTDPVWITGSLTLENGVNISLDPSYDTTSGVMLVDGKVLLSNNIKIRGSGSDGSYLMLLTTYDSRINGETAVEILNTGIEGIIYAGTGIINVANDNRLTEVTAWKLQLGNNVVVDYDSGLSTAFFSYGPSGAFSLVKGTYQFK